MNNLKMNKTSGQKLYELCLPYMNMANGMDFGDFIEETCIPIYKLEQYFNGERAVSEEDMVRFAYVCRMSIEKLEDILRAAYIEQEEKIKEEKRMVAAHLQWEEERRLKEKAKEEMATQKANILTELKLYGIEDIYIDSKLYSLANYYPLKFIMRYVADEIYLPKLTVLLEGCTDDDLVYKREHALVWAADSKLSYAILRLLENRKEWITAYINRPVDQGRTALHHYACSNVANPDGIDLLLRWGADVNAKDDYLWTPLHEAEACQNDTLVSRLYKLGAKSSVNSDGDTPADIRFRLDAIDAW